GLTAYYMMRLYLLVFCGDPKMSEDARHHLHEPPAAMTVPLVLLAIGSAAAGLAGVPAFLGRGLIPDVLGGYLAPVLRPWLAAGEASAAPISEWAALGATLLISLAGIAVGLHLHGRRRPAQAAPTPAPGPILAPVRPKHLA